jgi:hypothetical protein
LNIGMPSNIVNALQKLALRAPDIALHNGKIPSVIPSDAGNLSSVSSSPTAHRQTKDMAGNGEQLSQNL